MKKEDKAQLLRLLDKSTEIVVLQADNPDGDSLASALALEEILSDLGKKVHLVCGIDMPAHLRYLEGWSRVGKDLPKNFDLTVIVDANTISLFETHKKSGQLNWLKTKPLVVFDHHVESNGIDFATLTLYDDVVATGELIWDVAKELSWPVNLSASEYLIISIMSDSLGLTTDSTTSKTIRTVADLVDSGVSIAKLEQSRRELMRKEPELLAYKGDLLRRVEFFDSNRIACITIPWNEIEKYSSMYNPSMLVIDDMRLTVGVDIAIAFKTYPDGKITAKIRCNYNKGIGTELSAAFGGGGHAYASGFKTDGKIKLSALKTQVIEKASGLLDKIDTEKS